MSEQHPWKAVVIPEKSMHRMADALRSPSDHDLKDHPVTQEVMAHLGPQRTVVDIGAGIGRFTVPLAAMGCDVWAIEPSALMRDQLHQALITNKLDSRVHTVAGLWPGVEVPMVEVALAAFVIQFSPDPRQFVQAMEVAATVRCVMAIHVDHMFSGLDDLWAVFHPDRPSPTSPVFRDVYTLLWNEGIVADVRVVEDPPRDGFWRDPHKVLDGLADLLQIDTDAEREHLATLVREGWGTRGGTLTPSSHRWAIVSWTPRKT
ncbi:methyltransferase, FkbM family [Sulfobacillus thermosulfidooxidans DSM 9293]|uniref:Methyltransferase, FkbM family n=1 Tax=Sulfobacillus thermosulfidooxidans (strain DSM 9293 / VKM B-1269 / AT-1) TaxID=929705 RepID=A0A1W1WH13_SULTA|nr:methyltransferase domain-containing protein [Sulfobacillus thermosulfidooxidans]SMC05340.1 methyltransferase, FkbM family [Sulfobacillus thermosulfidooxidans DSM 9293]